MKKILIVLFVITLFCIQYVNASSVIDNNQYWEQMPDSLHKCILKTDSINKDAVQYYNGGFHVEDNNKTVAFLNILVGKQDNNEIRAFYFYLFNKICTKSDGAITSILGNYCQKMLINNPVYVINYFSSHSAIMRIYAMLLGSELYFKNEGTSTLKYNYRDFHTLINDEIGSDTHLKKTFVVFFKEIDILMKNMD